MVDNWFIRLFGERAFEWVIRYRIPLIFLAAFGDIAILIVLVYLWTYSP